MRLPLIFQRLTLSACLAGFLSSPGQCFSWNALKNPANWGRQCGDLQQAELTDAVSAFLQWWEFRWHPDGIDDEYWDELGRDGHGFVIDCDNEVARNLNVQFSDISSTENRGADKNELTINAIARVNFTINDLLLESIHPVRFQFSFDIDQNGGMTNLDLLNIRPPTALCPEVNGAITWPPKGSTAYKLTNRDGSVSNQPFKCSGGGCYSGTQTVGAAPAEPVIIIVARTQAIGTACPLGTNPCLPTLSCESTAHTGFVSMCVIPSGTFSGSLIPGVCPLATPVTGPPPCGCSLGASVAGGLCS